MTTHKVLMFTPFPRQKMTRVVLVTIQADDSNYLSAVQKFLSASADYKDSYAVNPETRAPLAFAFSYEWYSRIQTTVTSDVGYATFSEMDKALSDLKDNPSYLRHSEPCLKEHSGYADNVSRAFDLISPLFKERTQGLNIDATIKTALER